MKHLIQTREIKGTDPSLNSSICLWMSDRIMNQGWRYKIVSNINDTEKEKSSWVHCIMGYSRIHIVFNWVLQMLVNMKGHTSISVHSKICMFMRYTAEMV